MKDWLRLIRVAGLCTIASNIIASVAAVVYTRSLDFSLLGLMLYRNWDSALLVVLTSCLLYAAGMLWNDLADADRDRQLHPKRPLPAGRIPLARAWLVASLVSAAALLLAAQLGYRGLCTAGLVLSLSLLYDFGAKQVPWLGSLVMASVRASHAIFCLLLLGTTYYDLLLSDLLSRSGLLASSPPVGVRPLYPLLLFLYVFALTLVSELETRRGRRIELIFAGLLLLAVLVSSGVLAVSSHWVLLLHQDRRTWLLATAILLLVILVAWQLWRFGQPLLRAIREGRRSLVTPVLIAGLSGMIWFDALVASAFHPYMAIAILLLLPVYQGLGRVARMD